MFGAYAFGQPYFGDSLSGVPAAPEEEVEHGPTAAGGGMGNRRRRRKFELSEDAAPRAPFRSALVPVFAAPEQWTPEKDAEEDDDLMSVFALMIDEDLF